jgi:two-component system invasion response regulator UvrY
MYEGRTLIRLVIADDHELIREGIKKIVRPCVDLKVVGEASDLEQAIALVAQVRPDVVVLDITLPDFDGLDGLAELRRHFPGPARGHAEHASGRALCPGGPARRRPRLCIEGNCLVRTGRSGAPRGPGHALAGAKGAELLAREATSPQAVPPHHLLTPREGEIVALIGAGLQVKQVAAELGISISSVNTYRNRIFRKMGLSSNAALIRYALRNGLAG